MLAICVDDEPILLDWLCKSVGKSTDVNNIAKFTDENEAIEYASSNSFDIAFIDIELHRIDGITMAEKLREINPSCGIIFCTGHANYAIEAISRINVDGYLLKPINADDVQREIDKYKNRSANIGKLITVVLDNGINIFDKDMKPIHFNRSKTMDLFNELFKENGKSLSTNDLVERLWNSDIQDKYLFEKNKNYFTQLISDMRRTLENHDATDILLKTSSGYSLCMPLISTRSN